MVKDNENGYLLECDKCGEFGLPEEFFYIGPKDRELNDCNPFMAWEQICKDCNQ